jgi:hexulose-6-phosphate isomerase
MSTIRRRRFLETAVAASALAALRPRASVAAGGIRKAVLLSMLPKQLKDAAGAELSLGYPERFQLARDVGFEGIEIGTVSDASEAEAIRDAASRTGLVIHSVMNAEHWRSPLSSGDPPVVARSVAGMETSLRNAKLWGAGVVLLVPAVVDPQTGYREAWTRSQRVIRERILPLATELQVMVGIEEVWNKFLLSPLELNRYVDEFASPWVRAYVDVGNMVFYGYPQDWIPTVGRRMVRVHLKDFQLDRPNGRFAWKNLGEGDIDWPEVRKALAEVGYEGWATVELQGGDRAYLKDVVARFDRFLAGQPPATGAGS